MIAVDSLDPLELMWWGLGYGTGYERGWSEGWLSCDDEIQAMFGLIRPVLTLPTWRELEEARQPTDDPCSLHCGRCSPCIRASAVLRQGGDYLGQAARQRFTRQPDVVSDRTAP